jgi:molecular chaperone HscB
LTVAGASPFETLGLPARFDLDPADLEARVRALQRELHPDRHAQAGPAARQRALSAAVTVNDAYRTLRDEVTRAEALLRLHGRHSGEGDWCGAPQDLLMEMMALREELAEARSRRDVAAVERLASRVRAARDRTRAELSDAFGRGDLDAAERALVRMKYQRRFLDEVVAIEDEADAS